MLRGGESNMKKCKSCQKEIDPKAKKCPYCQTDQRNWFAKHPILTVLLVLFIIGMISSAGSKKGGSTSTNSTPDATTSESSSSAAQAEVKPTVAPTLIDAKTLVGEFDKNKLAAQEKYTGKVVQTTAYIKNISGGDFGDYYLSLEPSNEQYYFGTTIQCFFKDKKELTTLANGQSVTVIGTMQDMSIGIVEIKDCRLVK